MPARSTDRPSVLKAYQCKITQSTGMPTQIQLEVIFAENGIATRARVLQGTDKQRVNKDETGKRNVSLLSKVLE